jgi:ribonuclease-3
MSRIEILKRIQTRCGYTFKNEKLLDEALTHDSNRVNDRAVPTYQRLEFLGDSVLNLVVSDYLYRNNPDFTEGQLTDKRKELTEAKKQTLIVEKLNLKDDILFGQSVRKDQFGKYHSFVESMIGAVYIDGGLDAARLVIRRLWELSDSSNTATPAAAGACIIS